MKTLAMIKRISRCGLLAIFMSAILPQTGAAITVSSQMSATSLRATDTLMLTVHARWSGSEGKYGFATPRPQDNSALHLAGQSVAGSTFLEEGEFVSEKTWLFNFVCVKAGSTQVIPPVIVYTNTESGVTDSVAGTPMLLTIGAPPPPPFDYVQLLLYLAVVFAVVAIAFIAFRVFQQRRKMAREKVLHKTPEEQTVELLQQLRTSMREDRCEQYYSSLEKIVQGLWEARTGKRLTGKTPQEVGAILRENGIAEKEAAQVEEVLTDCHTVRFGGGRVALLTMEISFGTVTSWVKPSVDS